MEMNTCNLGGAEVLDVNGLVTVEGHGVLA